MSDSWNQRYEVSDSNKSSFISSIRTLVEYIAILFDL